MSAKLHNWDAFSAAGEPIDWPAGWSVCHVAETGSTNDDLVRLVESGDGEAVDRLVLATGHQTAGRGRRDRRWQAPPGANLLSSVLFLDVPDDPGELMRRCGVAICDAARTFGVDAVLKWPNDVLRASDEAKLCGMLAQRATSGAVVVGFGVNVGWFPDGAARVPDCSPAELLQQILREFDLLPTDSTDFHHAYRDRLSTVGRDVRVERDRDDVIGRVVGVEHDGRLVIESGDERLVIDAGDVVHLRPRP